MATITTEQELHDAIAASDPQLIIANDITLSLPDTIGYSAELTAGGSVLSWNSAQNGPMFSIVNGATLTIGNIVLDGLGNTVTLVSIQGSTVVMNAGAVMRNSRTTIANPAIAIGTGANLAVGGTLLMNGGLLTGISQDSVVSCWGGIITMNGNAAISQNQAYGIYLQGGTLNMAGYATISENLAARLGAGVRATANSIINMGLAAGDTPRISNNGSTNNSGGGVWLAGTSTLNMNYGASISGNSATSLAGGVGMNNSTLNMSGDSAISRNISTGVMLNAAAGGGVYGTAGAQVNMTGNASISGNQAANVSSQGGGVYLVFGGARSTLTMSGNASISGNTANVGAGLNLGNDTSLVMGVNAADTPSITGNISASFCGGMFIDVRATAALSAQSRIADNTAGTDFNGVCNSGTLQISQNIQIADSLHFNSLAAVPVVVQALGPNASIQLGSTPYIAPGNIPVVVAAKGPAYAALTDADSAAFIAPSTFPPGTPIYRNAANDQVLLGLIVEIQGAFLSIIRID